MYITLAHAGFVVKSETVYKDPNHSLTVCCLYSCFRYVVMYPHPQTAHTKTNSHSAFLPLCRKAWRLGEEGREDEVAWEGLSPNRSICFLVCSPGWLLAPAQLLHRLQPDARHKHTYTYIPTYTHTHRTALYTSKSQWAFLFSTILCFLFSIKRKRFSRWPSIRYPCLGRKTWTIN